MMKTVFLTIFAVFTITHLFASLKNNRRLRNITKPFILPSLLGFYLTAARPPVLALILALVFSWVGDVLLIRRGARWFRAGGTAFTVSHACFIAAYCKDIDFLKVGIGPVLLLAAFFTVIVILVFSRLKEHLPKALFYPMFFYLLLNGAMNCFAVSRCISISTAGALIAVVGAVLFFISDALLFFVRFKKDSPVKTHFPVMLTYATGELLIVLGLI